MIIRTHVDISKISSKSEKIKEEKMVEKLDQDIPAVKVGKKKKNIPAPIVEETIEVIEENKSEDEDLSQWLKEHDGD